tara:strand:- start:2239 stop:2607 length:369 start_codon:yes stop_codon:yes gene_type:complete
MNYTLTFIACHLIGIIGYQQTGEQTFLYLNLATMAYALFQFIKVTVLVLSPNWEVELSYAEHISYNWKLLHNATQLFSIYMFYTVGWSFVAGFSALYLLVTTTSILITITNVNLADTDGDDE